MKVFQIFNNFIFGAKKVVAPGSYPAIADTLQSLVGKRQWQSILRNVPDRRQLTEEASIKKGISEEELIKQVAERLGIPVFLRPKPADVYCLPEGLLLPDLRRAGVLPITTQQIITGIVCVDPAALNSIPQLYTGSNIYLSSWKAILAALDLSEQLYREKKQKIINKENEQKVFIYKKILGRLAEQASKVAAEQINLIRDSDSLSYSFKDKLDCEWSGKIDAKIAANLAEYLEDKMAESDSTIEVQDSNGEIFLLRLEFIHGRIEIRFEYSVRNRDENSDRWVAEEKARIRTFPRLVKSDIANLEPIFPKEAEAKVLLVDDNPTFATVLQKFLAKQGISVEYCLSVELALSRLKSANGVIPDLILSDLHMPGINGLEFIRLIKEDANWKCIPVIALTSDESSETELSLLGVGADAFVPKTKDPRILCMHAKRLIELKRAA